MKYKILANGKVHNVKVENCENLTEHDKREIAKLIVFTKTFKKSIDN